METEADMMERHSRLLARYAERAAALADDLCEQALAAETPEAKQSLTFAFHRMGRALRQSLALEAKLRRDAARAAQAEREQATNAETARRAERRRKVETSLTRLIWQEAEDEDWANERVEDLERFLAEDEAHDDVPDDIDAYILHLARELGLSPGADPGAPPAPPHDDGSGGWSSA